MNKLIVIGVSLILLFTTGLSLNAYATVIDTLNTIRVPITIYNSQNQSTNNPFQQMITLNINNYNGNIIYNGAFANFQFTYANNDSIPAWIESDDSGVLTIWLLLSQIPAESSLTIYLDIFPTNVNCLSASGTSGIGEAPQLSSVYGEYDDGSSIFIDYTNFKNSSDASFFEIFGTVTINDGLYISGSSPNSYVKSNALIYQGNLITKGIFEWYGYLTSPTNNNLYAFGGGDCPNGYPMGNYWFAVGGQSNYGYGAVGSLTGSYGLNYIPVAEGTKQIFSVEYNGYYNTHYLLNYNNLTVSYVGQSNFNGFGLAFSNGANNTNEGGNVFVQWFRVRFVPPNNIMPSFIIGSPLTPLNNINQNSNNSTSENLQLSNYSSYIIINPSLIIYLVIFLFLIFLIFIAIDTTRRRNK